MNKIFLDANILIDILKLRNKEGIEYKEAIKLLNSSNIYMSVLSIHIAYYVLKIKPKSKLSNGINDFCNAINILPLSKDITSQAMVIGYKDFEDTLQYITAIDSGCDFFFTRDMKDFSNLKKILSNKIKIISSLSELTGKK